MEKKKLPEIKIECLDHIAVRVTDMERSKQWYQRVLGLSAYELDEWGKVPVFLLAGTTGIALFPADLNAVVPDRDSKHVKLDHFAFRLGLDDFKRAQERYRALDLKFEFQDHYYFHSIYTRDPDGHVVELTTAVMDTSLIYKDR
jgi:catechol 2,3-dioxygenase-like lactoylglutathione lyase family enzyme